MYLLLIPSNIVCAADQNLPPQKAPLAVIHLAATINSKRPGHPPKAAPVNKQTEGKIPKEFKKAEPVDVSCMYTALSF